VISNPTAQMATFVPDLPGTFVAQLIVNDGIVDSTPATVQIQVVTLVSGYWGINDGLFLQS
jgi:hypothetical protein